MKWDLPGEGGSKIDGNGGGTLFPKHGARLLRERMAAGERKIGHSMHKEAKNSPQGGEMSTKSTLPKA